MWADVRYALRLLLRNPGFAAVAVATLALGIGANVVVFGLVNAVLLRPTPGLADPDEVVWLYTSDFSGPRYGASSYPDFEAFAAERDVLESATAVSLQPTNLVRDGETVRLLAEVVSPDYFELLGTPLSAGRSFAAYDGGSEPVAVIGAGLWRRVFGGDPSIVGRAIQLGGAAVTVVGVAPDGYLGAMRGVRTDVWVPFATGQAIRLVDGLRERSSRGLFVFGRLRDRVTPEAAQRRFDALARGLHDTYPRAWEDVTGAGRRVTVVPERDARVAPAIRGAAIGFAALLLGVVGLVLLLCCANVANLLLARAAGRSREVAVRLSLGAGTARLLRQLVTEAIVLAVAGAAAGVLAAVWVLDLIRAMPLPLPLPLEVDFGLDARVLGFTLVATALTALLFGLAPAIQAARTDLMGSLRDDDRSGAGRGRRLRGALVVAQVAVSVILLLGAGLFLRSLQRAAGVDTGVDAEGVVVARLDLRTQGYTAERARAFYADLQRRVDALPGVEGVAWARHVPLSGDAGRRGTAVAGYEPAEGEDMEFDFNVVGPGYLELLRVPLVRGRGLTERDRDGAPNAAVVNEAFAERFWPGRDPLGQRLDRFGAMESLEVVGVVADGRYRSLTEETRPYVYVGYLQEPVLEDGPRPSELKLHARVRGDVATILPLIRREIQALDPDLPVLSVRSMEDEMALSVLPQRAASLVLGLFAAVALGLAAVGLYGLLAYAVSRRTREIGIRMAMGAGRAQVVRMVAGEGLRLAGLGIVIGLLIGLPASRLASGLLLETGFADPLALIGTIAVLALVAVAATTLPALRAASVQPARAVRYE